MNLLWNKLQQKSKAQHNRAHGIYNKLFVSTTLLFGHRRYRKQTETYMLGKLSQNNANPENMS